MNNICGCVVLVVMEAVIKRESRVALQRRAQCSKVHERNQVLDTWRRVIIRKASIICEDQTCDWRWLSLEVVSAAGNGIQRKSVESAPDLGDVVFCLDWHRLATQGCLLVVVFLL